MKHGVTTALVCLLLLGLSRGPANADQAQDKEKAKALLNQAETHYHLGDMPAALKSYEDALKLWRRTSIIYNIA